MTFRSLSFASAGAVALACAVNNTPATSTKRCVACSSEEACVTGVCVKRIPIPSSWAAEIVPPPGDSIDALTEVSAVSGANPILTCDSTTEVTVGITYAATKSYPRNAGIVISTASLIPGRPDLSFETQVVADLAARSLVATVAVPTAASKRGAAMIRMTPSPDDRNSPPRTFVATLSPSLAFDVRANDDLALRGTLVDATNQTLRDTFVARAFQAEAPVSDSVEVGQNVGSKDGVFILSIPVQASLAPIEVVLLPQTDGQPYFVSAPRLPTNGVYANLEVKLPTYISSPAQFSLDVRGDGPDEPAVAGELVRALTRLQPTEPTDVGRRRSHVKPSPTPKDGPSCHSCPGPPECC